MRVVKKGKQRNDAKSTSATERTNERISAMGRDVHGVSLGGEQRLSIGLIAIQCECDCVCECESIRQRVDVVTNETDKE
jgi:hypothetical protein